MNFEIWYELEIINILKNNWSAKFVKINFTTAIAATIENASGPKTDDVLRTYLQLIEQCIMELRCNRLVEMRLKLARTLNFILLEIAARLQQ